MSTSKDAWGVLCGTLLAVSLAAGCGPGTNRALVAAKQDFVQARSDPAVIEYARAELNEAERTLAAAEREHEEGDEEETTHLAGVAETEIATARTVAEKKTRELEVAKLEEELENLNARETTRGIVITLSDVYFELDSANLRPSAAQELAPLAAFLRAHPDRALAIEGHADATGADSYNLQLSRRRAEAVENFLVASGVDPRRISSTGFGEEFPVASNETASGRALNRRVEMLVMNPGVPVRVTSTPLVYVRSR